MSNPEVFGGARWIAEYAMRRGGKHAPVFRRRFFMKPWRRARCAICGLGHFHLRFNGRAVSDDLLTPAFTRYDLRCEYYLYDVTDFLIPGENVVEIVLGNSFYNQTAPDRLRKGTGWAWTRRELRICSVSLAMLFLYRRRLL